MTERSCLAVILAAGDGTRMKSDKSKVLHDVGGLPMVAHVVRAATGAGVQSVALVVGRDADKVEAAAKPFIADLSFFLQEKREGTAHAVLAARDAIAKGFDDVLIMFGDTPLIDADSLSRARAKLAEGNAVVVMGFRTDNPAGYGRLVEHDHKIYAIVEDKECNEDQKKIKFCNGGLMAISGKDALRLLGKVGNRNAKGEYYLTDIVAIARNEGLHVASLEVPADSVLGVNTRVELAEIERIFQNRMRKRMMLDGVSMIAPETVFFTWDTQIGAETLLEPNIWFGPGVTVAANVVIHAFSHLEGATIAAGSSVGPFARLRPGADLQENAKVGNFVEIKKAVIGNGAKVSHLTYIGDAFIGPRQTLGQARLPATMTATTSM